MIFGRSRPSSASIYIYIILFVKSKGQADRKIFKIMFGQRCPRKKKASNKKMIRQFTYFEVSEKFKGTTKYELPRLLCTSVLACQTLYAMFYK